MSKPLTQEEFGNLSDEEIMNMASAPEMVPGSNAEPTTTGEEDPDADPDDATGAAGDDDDGAAAADDAAGATDSAGEADEADEAEAAEKDGAAASGDEPGSETTDTDDTDDDAFIAKGKPEPKKDAADAADKSGEEPAKADADPAKPGDVKTESTAPVDYKAAYEKIMAPFKAAGKTVELQSPDEVIQLMQMGAHYTKKMQALQPNLKLLRMLENNELLDEGKLSYLIDISRKDPAAIQKLIREAGIDPMDIDTSVEPAYKPGDHRVSDNDMAFQATLEEVTSDPAGKEMIVSIHKTWDKASKDALWEDPKIMSALAEQKSLGIYDTISTEIERRKTLGQLRDEPFLRAYETVGKELQAQGRLTPQPTTDPKPGVSPGQTAPASRVVETRPAARKTVSNSERAKAASPTKATPRKGPAADFNPLALSDEDFEKNAALVSKL